MSFTDEYESEMVQRLAQSHDKERIMRHLREQSIQENPEMDEHEKRWQARSDQFDRIAGYLHTCTERLSEMAQDFRLVNLRRGEVYSARFLLKQTYSVVQVDLKKPEESYSLPTALVRAFSNFPRQPISNLLIINEGTGVLNFSTPKYASDTQAQTVVPPPASSTNPVPIQLNFGMPVVERMNLLATTADLTVNLITVI
jgi:hypothetical protein